MTPQSLPPESRKALAGQQGTVFVEHHLQAPLSAFPTIQSEVLVEDVALNGTVFRIIGGPGLEMRAQREFGDARRDASADLAALAGVRVLRIVVTWNPASMALTVGSPERPGVVADSPSG